MVIAHILQRLLALISLIRNNGWPAPFLGIVHGNSPYTKKTSGFNLSDKEPYLAGPLSMGLFMVIAPILKRLLASISLIKNHGWPALFLGVFHGNISYTTKTSGINLSDNYL